MNSNPAHTREEYNLADTVHTVRGIWAELRSPSGKTLYQMPLSVVFDPGDVSKLCQLLAEARKPGSRPLSYRKVGKLLNASYVTVWRWIYGKSKPNVEHQALIQGCLALCVNGQSSEALLSLECTSPEEKLPRVLRALQASKGAQTG